MSTSGLIPVTAYSRAERYVGEVYELAGREHPLIQWWLSRCGFGFDVKDEVPWCSAFVNGIAWDLRLPRSKSALARSWLEVGSEVSLLAAKQGFDVVVLKRGGPTTGHVGFFSSIVDGDRVSVLGGNQGNAVSVKSFPRSDVLSVRRLREWS